MTQNIPKATPQINQWKNQETIYQSKKGVDKNQFIKDLKVRGINFNLNRNPDHKLSGADGTDYLWHDKDYIVVYNQKNNEWKINKKVISPVSQKVQQAIGKHKQLGNIR